MQDLRALALLRVILKFRALGIRLVFFVIIHIRLLPGNFGLPILALHLLYLKYEGSFLSFDKLGRK